MKDILDGLNDLFDSIYNSVTGSGHDSGDPLLDQAWQELDSYLKNDRPRDKIFRHMDSEFAEFDRRYGTDSPKDGGSKTGSQSSHHKQAPEDPLLSMARELVRDYHNLEIKPGANADTVKTAYKTMIKQYHPDRFANNPEKQQTATIITSKLNQSYARIMKHLGER